MYSCYNKAKLTFKKVKTIGSGIGQIGGIIGSNGSLGEVRNVYNAGNITLKSMEECVGSRTDIGGLIGENDGKIYNSYSIGELESKEELIDKVIMGSLVGYEYYEHNHICENCYYLENKLFKSDTENVSIYECGLQKNANEMKTIDFIKLLNNENDEDIWILDKNNINNGYPILNWQEKS